MKGWLTCVLLYCNAEWHSNFTCSLVTKVNRCTLFVRVMSTFFSERTDSDLGLQSLCGVATFYYGYCDYNQRMKLNKAYLCVNAHVHYKLHESRKVLHLHGGLQETQKKIGKNFFRHLQCLIYALNTIGWKCSPGKCINEWEHQDRSSKWRITTKVAGSVSSFLPPSAAILVSLKAVSPLHSTCLHVYLPCNGLVAIWQI